MSRQLISPIFGIAILGWTIFPSAQTWKPGDTLVYELVSNSKISGGHLPSQAYAPHSDQSRSILISITGLDNDGNALVHVKEDISDPGAKLSMPMAVRAAARKSFEEQNRYKEFDTRLTRDGALLVETDNSLSANEAPKPGSMSQADLAHYRDAVVKEVNSPEFQASLARNDVAGTFDIPNIVALSCAKRASLAAGDTWHVVSKSNQGEYDVSVQGTQSYRSHNTVVLNVKSNSDNPNDSVDTTATVYYDPRSRLVIGMHVVTFNNIKVTGMTSASTSDLNLE